MDNTLNGKSAWIVGASGSIGSGVARVLAEQGMHVWISGRNRDPLYELSESIRESGLACSVAALAGATDYEATVTAIRQSLGRLDVLVNTTASPRFETFEALTDDHWVEIFESKLLVYVRSMRAAIPLMRDCGGGSIINISGRGGRQPSAVHLAGGSMNAAINLLTKGIADTYRDFGVRANVIAPGPIRSPRLAELVKSQESATNSMTARLGEVQDVVNAVVFLASEHSSHINGINLPVDGGSIGSI